MIPATQTTRTPLDVMTNKPTKKQMIEQAKQKADRELDRQIREALEKDKD